MKVKPKLYLNMSPQTAEDGSLAFARNMKIDDDGNLVSDYGYKNISAMANYNIVGHIVGLDNKIYFFCHTNNVSKIVEYDEVAETATELTTTWTYSGGEIDGYVNTNQSGEKILTVGEYLDNGSEIPLKHINLKEQINGVVKSWPFANVEQSLYSQAPKCPTANLILKDTYSKAIPNGTYVFFIRYKIRKDVYTNWFLCSCPIFAGTSENITTLQGGLEYINLHRDSAKSFIFQIDFAQIANFDSYERFQLGFIITHDEATDARIWKTFDITKFVRTSTPNPNQNLIYFDYDEVEEANIDDLLETTYELYNVRNITSFKNKLYISNYKESNFNSSELLSLSKKFDVGYTHTSAQRSDNISPRNIKWKGNTLIYNNQKGYFDKINIGGNIPSTQSIADFIRVNSDILNYKFNNFSKGDVTEREDIIHFDLKWDSGYDPDLIPVHNMVNNIYAKNIFGNDFDLSFAEGRIGLVEIQYYSDGYWRFALKNPTHPWYSKNLTFCYGSISDNDIVYLEHSKNHVVPFNETTGQPYNNYAKTWISRDAGFTDASYDFIRSNTEKEISRHNRFFYGYCYITSGTNIYNIDLDANFNNDNYVVDNSTDVPIYPFEAAGNINYKNGSVGMKSDLSGILRTIILTKAVGVDENNVLILKLENADTGLAEEVKLNSISIVFKSCEFKVESPEDIGKNDDDNYNKRFYVTLKSCNYTSIATISVDNKYITSTDTLAACSQSSTLMPLSKYAVYAHFVDESNIISNGVFIKNIDVSNNYNNVDLLKLTYKITGLTNTKYKSFFLSIANIGNTIIECFAYQKYIYGDTKFHILQCLEADALLYNINDNITIIGVNSQGKVSPITDKAKYYTSGHSTPIIAFGNCGFICWNIENSEDYTNYKLYVSISKDTSSEFNNKLIKATPYIKLANTNYFITIDNGFYNSYFCLIKKPSFDLSSSAYCSGNDVYAADRSNGLALKEFDYYIQQQDSARYCIRSNFNLNYLSLTEDISDKLFAVGKASSGVKQVAKVVNSAILSFIYELKSMYKDFSNKYFRPYDTDYKIDFDNTVRVSHVLSDETFNNSIFKFGVEDYYNVPTDRGIIVNLFAIGANIFVHTKTAFYKFDGNQTIAASNNDITLQESEPFETGVTQLFDSEYGYGGIYNKEAGCITFDSYIFYDAMSNHIFAYGGNSQVQLIDASIYKMLCYYKPTYCRTLHDDANHRVLFEFTTDNTAGTYKTFTISYNYKSKSFVSLHDLGLVNAFHSRYISYSYKDGLISLFNETATIDNTPLVQDMNVYKIYGNATTVCFIQFGADTQDVQSSPFNIAVVIFPQENYREAFNNLKYIGDIVKDNYDEKTNYEVIKFPQITRTNPVSKFYVITDRCVSTPVSGDVNDTQRPANPDDYKGFKFDMGSWNTNYFRNALNDNNVYQYPNQPGVNERVAGGQTVTRHPNIDNNSLVYGKYFILVFDFIKNRPIKFEEISVNSNQY